jgi:CubicO group peptidase (beta-lactamase class C family)
MLRPSVWIGLTLVSALSGAPLSLVGGTPASAPRSTAAIPTTSKVGAPAELAAVRAALLERVRRGEVPSLAVGVARGSKVLWEEGLGWADREARVPATPSTRYPVASVSKSITATGALALVARGALHLEDPVQQLLRGVRLPSTGESPEGVLVSHLLAHTSGIPHLWHYEYLGRPETIVGRKRLIRDHAVVAAPPGERFLYSNLGYGVLAEVLERAGRASFQQVMERAVFRPLGMRRTTVDSWVGRPGVVRGYGSDGKPIPYRYRLAPDGGAGFFSTIDDLLRYGRFHLGTLERAAPAPSAAIATALGLLPAGGHYLRGWGVVHLPEGTMLISDGEVAGGTAAIVLIPEKQLVVVVLCNATGGPASESVVAILSALLPGFGEQFAAAVNVIETEIATPGILPKGRFEGTLADGAGQVAASLDFADPAAPRVELGKTPYLFQVTGWERGALQATVEGELPVGAGRGRTHRLLFTLWAASGGLQGFAQEELFEDRPRFGVPHFVRLQRPALVRP